MTEPAHDNDEAWLAALASPQPASLADTPGLRQAALLRGALEKRAARMDLEVPVADASLFREVLQAVREDRDDAEPGDTTDDRLLARPAQAAAGSADIRYSLRGNRQAKTPHQIPVSDTDSDAMFSRSSPGPVAPKLLSQRRPWAWGLAAAMVLGTVLVLQMTVSRHDDDEAASVLRGSQATVLVVSDPDMRAAELAALIRTAGGDPHLSKGKDGKVLLRVNATPGALEALAAERILPLPKDGQIVLVLEKPAPRRP